MVCWYKFLRKVRRGCRSMPGKRTRSNTQYRSQRHWSFSSSDSFVGTMAGILWLLLYQSMKTILLSTSVLSQGQACPVCRRPKMDCQKSSRCLRYQSSGYNERHLRCSGKLQKALFLLLVSAQWNTIFYVTTIHDSLLLVHVSLMTDKTGYSETF